MDDRYQWIGRLIVGILMSIWGARRVTLPLGNLVQATIEAADGNLNQPFTIKTGDEVEVLANNFSTMIVKILEHRADQEKQLIEIQRFNSYTEKLLTTMSDGLLSIRTRQHDRNYQPGGSKSTGDFTGTHSKGISPMRNYPPGDNSLFRYSGCS